VTKLAMRAFVPMSCLLAGCAAQLTAQPPSDLGCLTGPHAATWQKVKGIFRNAFPEDGAPTEPVVTSQLSAALESAMQILTDAKALAPETQGECGMGRLALQMLTVNTVEDTGALVQLFSETEALASPILTFLLDVNWVLLGQAGWPLFAYLGQVNLRKQREGITINDEGDGLDTDVPRAFFAELKDAMGKTDYERVIQVSSAFLSAGAPATSPISLLTAYASQAMALPAGDRVLVLQDMQGAFRRMIGSAAELDIALSTKWPLWTLVHSAVDPFYAD